MTNKKIELEINVKFMRLTGGDDIIAAIEEDEEVSMVIRNPMKILIDADLEVGRQTIYMHKWIPQGISKNNYCKLNKKDVVFVSEIEEDIKEYYFGIVFEMIEDAASLKVEKKTTEYMDEDKKVISFKSKDTKLN